MKDLCIPFWRIAAVCAVMAAWCGPGLAEEPAPQPADPGAGEAAEAKEQSPDTAASAPAGNSDGLGLEAAHIRVELTTTTGYHSGRRSRSGDYAFRTNVDYEIPVLKHMTVAPRIIPLMYYNENGEGDETLFAFGVGVVLRGYSNGEEQRGWFGEGGLHFIGQTGKFEGNSGGFNFMEEIAAGYMFKNGVHAAVKVNHISNAGIADDNAGINNVGLGIGYSFKR